MIQEGHQNIHEDMGIEKLHQGTPDKTCPIIYQKYWTMEEITGDPTNWKRGAK